MKETTLDLQALKTFVLGMELKSFVLAAKQQHKSTSAVSAHLKKLEMQTNSTLVRKEGRNLLPTEQGEHLLIYAKKMLALNDEVIETLRCIDLEGSVVVGLQEDFAAGIITECLGRFSRINEQVQLNTMIEKYKVLISSVQDGSLDLAVTWQGNTTTPYSDLISHAKIEWIASPDFPLALYLAQKKPLPLVMVEPNCLFKQKAIEALNSSGIRWKVVYQSQSLSGIWPAVNAGLGITARTSISCPTTLNVIDKALPEMGNIGVQIHRTQEATNNVRARLTEIITSEINEKYN
ncbi:LysR substrate-binding domain-containing protein [Vibrio splendidus]|uniref:LysR family transcriptional regulator n=1 Tax=Vibrio splendidus TaxID=29497 RepID=A0A2N7EL86_VIBSP|nr:LysR substrate-binding domain-containing protein [Vibrio splendidus]OEF83898.1 LysR family transcriptional regulator [Vibrio splendidus 1F-157]PMI48917.1 LysR family transcriptional regulator [Vibrio splendidus]PMI52180.1 LysR family transcriptional regulator [Vibrio splendidus]PMI78072.1 LysR family transcriptional regulator [Vibrio splendidus]PMJ72658.1 LysR family transcriptional regulator [Vibrio splendidus]